MSAEEIVNGKPDTMYDAMQAVEEGGYKVENLTPTRDGYDMVWDEEHNRFALLDENGKTVYCAGDVTQNRWELWKIVDGIPENYAEEGYSYYAGADFAAANVEVSAGFDAGDKAVASVKLAIPAGTAKNVTVRTTGDCALTIDAADSDVDHYGTAGSVDIQAVAADTYTLYGTVTDTLTVRKGHADLRPTARVENLVGTPSEGAEVIISYDVGSDIVGNVSVDESVQMPGGWDSHVHDWEWKYEGLTHWQECTYGGTHEQNRGAHTFDGQGVCACGLRLTQGLAYTFKNNTYRVTGIGDAAVTGGLLVIPGTYDDGTNGEAPVRVDSEACQGNNSITTLIVTEGAVGISNAAFQNCTGLRSVYLPSSLTSLATNCFKDSVGLQKVVLAENSKINDIGYSAFENCSSLESINLPEDHAINFGSKSSGDVLTTPFIGSGLLDNDVEEGVVYLGNWVIGHRGDQAGSVTLRSGTVGIADRAFYKSGITGITFNKELKFVGDQAVFGQSALQTAVFPAGSVLTELPGQLFYECRELREVTLPAGLVSIGGSAFSSCGKLTGVSIPSTVTSIGGSAFQYCTSLKTINLPSSLKEIGYSAFRESGLTSVTIPASVASIGSSAFSGCTSLSGIDLSANGELTSIENYAFSGCTALATVKLPSALKSIGGSAFSGCTALASVELPAALETIESDAFNGCALTSVTLPASLKEIGMRAFYNTKITSVTIPASVTFIGGRAFAQEGESQALTSIVFENPAGWLYNGEEIAAEDLTGEKAVEAYNQSLSSLFASWTRPEE